MEVLGLSNDKRYYELNFDTEGVSALRSRRRWRPVQPSAGLRSIAFVLAPRLLWPIQQESESIENVAAKDADLLIHYEKLTAKRAAKHQQISADHANGTRSAVERQQFVRSEERRVGTEE